MKVCVISNSHAASLKIGYQSIKERFAGVDVKFFASPAHSLRSLICQNGILSSTHETVKKSLRLTSGGSDHIRVGDYDQFLVYGLHFNIWPEAGEISKALMKMLFEETQHVQTNYQIAAMLQVLAPGNVWVGPCPLPSALHDRGVQDRSVGYTKAVQGYQYFLSEKGINLLPQPRETVEHGSFTVRRYVENAASLHWGNKVWDKGYPSGDRVHMNAEFGALYMSQFLNLLTKKIAE